MRKVIFIIVVMLCFFYVKPINSKATTTSCTPDQNATISGTKDINYEIGSPAPNYSEGVTAVDICGNSVTVEVSSVEVNLEAEGSYYLYYRAKGSSVTKKVNVFFDMTKPVITGYEEFNVEVNTERDLVDFKRTVTVTDNKDMDIASKLQIDATKVDLQRVGKYPLTYTVTDHKNNTTSETIYVNVVDTIFPVLENVKNLELEVKKDVNFDFWAGITYSDNSNVVTPQLNKGSFDINKIGTYNVTYIVKDGVGNETKKTIKVSVVDKVKPELKMNRVLRFNLNEDLSTINWLSGLEVIDNYEEITLDKVICDTSNVNFVVPGTYKVVYFVSDISGNNNYLVVDVIIFDDDKPQIHNVLNFDLLVNSEPINYLENITASDLTDGDLTAKIILHDKNINLNKVGKYKLFYIVTDLSGNTTIAEAIVNVYDNEKPVISGTKDLTIEVNNTLFDFLQGITAHDNLDGDLIVQVDSSLVNLNQLGEYYITYIAIDSNENKTEIPVKVTVVDTTKPVLANVKDLSVFKGGTINILEHVTATDNYDGDITSQIKISGNYDFNKAGVYQIKIEVEDSSGNYTSAYIKLTVEERHKSSQTDDKTMYYIIGGSSATLIISGAISIISRKKSVLKIRK